MKTFNEIKALVVVAVLACQPVHAVQVWDAKVTGSSQFSVTHQDPEPEQPTEDSDESTTSAPTECDFWPKCVIER